MSTDRVLPLWLRGTRVENECVFVVFSADRISSGLLFMLVSEPNRGRVGEALALASWVPVVFFLLNPHALLIE